MRILPLGLLALSAGLSACTAQEAANLVSGAQTVCKDTETGTAIVTQADPSLVAHNSSTGSKVLAACGAINALPAGAFAPVTTPAS